jgi:mycothiol synthase
MSSSLLRELRGEDAEQVAALFVECFGGARLVDADEIRSWLGNAEFERAWMRVLEQDGRVVGYGDIWPQTDDLWLDVAGLADAGVFFAWAEEEARERAIATVRVQLPHEHPLAAVAAARGYRSVRHSFTMEIALDDRPSPAALPAGIELRSYRAEDAEPLRAAVNEAFAGDPLYHEASPEVFQEFYVRARGFDPELWLLAWDGEELAGFALDYPSRGSDDRLGWVNTLGVRPRWRRRGLGGALLRASFLALFDRGLRRVGLGVDAQNVTGALRLYERAGMRVVRRSDGWERRL